MPLKSKDKPVSKILAHFYENYLNQDVKNLKSYGNGECNTFEPYDVTIKQETQNSLANKLYLRQSCRTFYFTTNWPKICHCGMSTCNVTIISDRRDIGN